MSKFHKALLGLLVTTWAVSAQNCNIGYRRDCGAGGTSEEECVASGCCWSPTDDGSPYCFFPGCTDPFNWNGVDIGFTDDFLDDVKVIYKSQLNVENVGAVMASPDDDPDYYYHWMRDAALSIKAWLDINDNNYEDVRDVVDPYVQWVNNAQNEPAVNGVDVRVEPKFVIPSGEVWESPWCRPQTDGPALRAMALAQYGTILDSEGLDTDFVWNLIKIDLDWVENHWFEEGCDLWEEVSSDDFFFNRMGYVYSLNKCADFADLIGDTSGKATDYRNLANTIKDTIPSHEKENYLWETDIRPRDTAVLHAIATFGEYIYGPDTPEAASTIIELADTFCGEYPINQDIVSRGDLGLLFGRYPGDTYQEGNPWQLLTAVTAEVFYKGGNINIQKALEAGRDFELGSQEHGKWKELLQLPIDGVSILELAEAQISAGDAIMTQLWNWVQFDEAIIYEQINKFTGEQKSAESLTWSYANVLHARWERDIAQTRTKEARDAFAKNDDD